MKKKLGIYTLCLLITSMLICCQDDQISEITQSNSVITKAVPTPNFNWETSDWMPTPPNQTRIPSPWIGQGSIVSAYGIEISNDHKASEGWILLYNTFDSSAPGQLVNPYFILYNKYRGLMRIYLYLTTQFIATSSYIQDGLSVISSSETSILNFVGQDFIDATINRKNYMQMQAMPIDGSLPLASNRWYMMQYEMAYDPNISQIPYNNIQLNWMLNYYNVQKITLGGEQVGTLNGVLGSSSNSNIFSSLIGAGSTIGTGVLAGVGKAFITNNTINSAGANTLGLPNDIFKSLSSGVSSAISAAAGNLPGAIINLLSAVIGGSTTPTPISLNLRTNIELKGTGTNAGSFPSSPLSFWVPGTNIPSNAVGYIPLNNLILGVVNFVGKPQIQIKVYSRDYEVPDEPFDPDRMLSLTEYRGVFPSNIDYSAYLRVNPEVTNIARVTIERQDIVIIGNNPNYQGNPEFTDICPSEIKWIEGGNPYTNWLFPQNLKVGVRFTIRITPNNGTPSSIILKTFQLNDVWIY